MLMSFGTLATEYEFLVVIPTQVGIHLAAFAKIGPWIPNFVGNDDILVTTVGSYAVWRLEVRRVKVDPP
jgi:hypothetical protein